jgi:DNA-binding YbaB/EbfC family protein
MKLPKGFGNMGALMRQAQEAMERAKNLEKELEMEIIELDRGGVKVKYNGAGQLLSLSIDASLVDPNDIESLEDALLLALREGYAKSVELRKEKFSEITGGLPLPPGLG